MPPVAGRPHRAQPQPVRALVAAGIFVVLAGCSTTTHLPASTQLVAGETGVPATPVADRTTAPRVTPRPAGTDDPAPTPAPTDAPPRVTSITPGTVGRSTIDVTATYHVNAAITVATGALDVTTAITVRNDSGDGIDRLELNTVAARLGNLAIAGTTVDDAAVTASIDDQTITVPLGGILAAGSTTTLRVEYRATLRKGLTGSDWMFSRSGGTLALYRWIPWVSRTTPFDHPNDGQPFVSSSSPQVDVEILTDEPMMLAAPTAEYDEYVAGSGNYWSFSVTNVRDVAIVLAKEFRIAHGEADGIPVRAFSRPGGPSATKLLDLAVGAIRSEADQLGMAFPATSMTVIDMPGGDHGLESAGMVWVPRKLDTRNRTYAIYQGVAHQWFYGLVGNDQRAEPFADEGPSDLLARTVLHTMRTSRCSQGALDKPLTRYGGGCYFEVVYVQGGRVLDELRQRMGTTAFWTAIRTYLNEFRDDIGGTKQLLEALRAGSKQNLLPLLRSRFPSLY